MEILVRLVEAITWPLTIMISIFLFRHELRKAAQRLTTLKYKDISIIFNKDLEQIENDLSKIKFDRNDKKQLEDDQTLSSYERLIRIADISPRAAIMEAWRDIEITTKQVTEAYEIASIGHIAGVKAVRKLVEKGVLPSNVISVYERLRRLRAKAAHTAEFEIDPVEGQRYIDTAHQFFMTLRFLLNQTKDTSQPINPADPKDRAAD